MTANTFSFLPQIWSQRVTWTSRCTAKRQKLPDWTFWSHFKGRICWNTLGNLKLEENWLLTWWHWWHVTMLTSLPANTLSMSGAAALAPYSMYKTTESGVNCGKQLYPRVIVTVDRFWNSPINTSLCIVWGNWYQRQLVSIVWNNVTKEKQTFSSRVWHVKCAI